MVEIKTLIDEEKLHNRIDEIAKQIEEEYKGKELTLICILKGSVFFTVDLAKRINVCTAYQPVGIWLYKV